MGPIFFEPYAADLVKRLPVFQEMRVLELACGTGIVTRQLRDYLPKSASLVATDLNEAMIDRARGKFSPEENVEWKQVDATSLPFSDASFDAVVCQFGLMFFADKEAAVREVHRVLVQGGTFLFNVWDAMEHNELSLIAHETVGNLFRNNPPDFYQIPFGFHDPRQIETLLEGCGFEDAQVTIVTKSGTCSFAKDAATGLVEGNPIIGQILERKPADVSVIVETVATAIRSRCGDAPVQSKMQALVWSAVKATEVEA
jgi:SAM-dependent methyltransferase